MLQFWGETAQHTKTSLSFSSSSLPPTLLQHFVLYEVCIYWLCSCWKTNCYNSQSVASYQHVPTCLCACLKEHVWLCQCSLATCNCEMWFDWCVCLVSYSHQTKLTHFHHLGESYALLINCHSSYKNLICHWLWMQDYYHCFIMVLLQELGNYWRAIE